MTMRSTALALILVMGSILASTANAHAISMQECSAKYKAAQAAGATKGMKWNDFRKAECSDDAAKPAASTTAAPKAEKKEPASSAAAPAPAPATATAGKAIFPSAVAPKYSKEREGKARMLTCLDQYNANKTGNGNGGMKWIAKGGGYYSECNKRLKG